MPLLLEHATRSPPPSSRVCLAWRRNRLHLLSRAELPTALNPRIGVGFAAPRKEERLGATPERRSPGQIARECFEAIFNRHDPDAIRAFGTENSVDHFLALGVDARGPDEVVSFFEEFLAAFPDWQMRIENIVEDDRHAVVQWRGTGTFKGAPFQGLEPTGCLIGIPGCDVFRFDEDGKIAEVTIYYDGAEFARQIGMLPPQGSTLDKWMTEAFNALTRLRRRIDR